MAFHTAAVLASFMSTHARVVGAGGVSVEKVPLGDLAVGLRLEAKPVPAPLMLRADEGR